LWQQNEAEITKSLWCSWTNSSNSHWMNKGKWADKIFFLFLNVPYTCKQVCQ
jgi:hypothetical protein